MLVILIREKNLDLRVFWHRKKDLFNLFLDDVKKNPGLPWWRSG